MNTDIKYWLAFNQVKHLGPINFHKIIRGFPDLETAWKLGQRQDFLDVGLNEKQIEEIIQAKRQISPNDLEERLYKEEIKVVTVLDNDYPILLKEIYGCPPLIYYKGMIEQLSGPTIAIVGTRRMSSYGKLMTEKIARELVENQICIVSGLAVGVDAIAHITSLNFNGITAAVLGSGLSSYNIYPSINRKLAHNILEKNGVLISEYPPEMLPLKHNFPLRNRIIAGLSLATIVVEAGESSGALITAKYALEFNREIFAVPGNANSLTSAGPNNLIKQGANLITSAEDIFLNLNLQYTTNRREKISADSPIQQIILDQLSFEPIHINNLQKQTNLSAAELNASLTIMELQGKVRNLGNMHYTKNI